MKLQNDPTEFGGTIADVEKYIGDVDIPALVVTCAYLSGDWGGWFRREWRPASDYGVLVAGISESAILEIKARALELLRSLYAAGKPVNLEPTVDFVHLASLWLMGDQHAAEVDAIVPLAYEELTSVNHDPRRPTWTKGKIAPERSFNVLIIGAGESGLLTSHRLKQAGVDFTIFEKNKDVGGTWYENRYPGCRVDCNSYSYSFASARAEWDEFYGRADEVGAYLKMLSERWGVRDSIDFEHEVTQCVWSESEQNWRVTARGPQGEKTVTADVVISAVGALNRPMMPEIDGMNSFSGPSFHTARWDHSVDYSGKRIGVIGTGATSLQMVPELAKTAAQVKVFARTIPWLLPTALLEERVPEGFKWFMRSIPTAAIWYRLTIAVPSAIGMLNRAIVDPSYPPTERAVSAVNDEVRAAITAWVEDQITDTPELSAALIPQNSPVGAKRIVRDNGRWARTLKRENVQLVNTGIARITAAGVVTNDDSEHEFDILVYATGFLASKYLSPMEITGRDGTNLEHFWDGDPRAYIGVTVPKFPNLFILSGPNTGQVVHGGSQFLWTEFNVTYLMSIIQTMLSKNIGAIEVKSHVYHDYTRRIDEANLLRAWGFSKVNSWYKNARGRVTSNYPFSSAEIWSRLHSINGADFSVATKLPPNK